MYVSLIQTQYWLLYSCTDNVNQLQNRIQSGYGDGDGVSNNQDMVQTNTSILSLRIGIFPLTMLTACLGLADGHKL